MKKINTLKQLNRAVERAGKREDNDDHLVDEDRQEIVRSWKEHYPNDELPEDWNDAYVEIVI